MEERYTIGDHGAVWAFHARGGRVMGLSGGADGALAMERVKCGKFSELSVLPDKFRLHRSEDGCVAELESSGVIPFGCEYRVSRQFSITPGCAVLTDDIAAVNFGRIDGIELEPLVFTGEWSRLELVICGEDQVRRIERGASGIVYSGGEVPLLARVVFASGRRIEAALGADVWRHRAAAGIPGASSSFEISVSGTEIRIVRRVLVYAPEVEPKRRPWRFTLLIGWSDAAGAPITGGEEFTFTSCAMEPKVRRDLRNLVRRAQTPLVWRDVAPLVCLDARHVSHAGQGDVAHFDLEELVADWRWANRLLRKKGLSLRMSPDARSIFADSVIVGILGGALEVLE